MQQTAATHQARASEISYTPVLLELDDAALDELQQKGAVVLSRREQFAAVCIPDDAVEAVSRVAGIKRADASHLNSINLDKARAATGVDAVHTGIDDTTLPFTGKGVIVGLSDIGLDPQHPAFDNRIEKIHIYNDYKAEHLTYDQASCPTDTYDEFHATHVTGILAGGNDAAPYNGVATGATIIATLSSLSDAAIISGVEEIIAASKASERPAVINLSLGSTLGPHDGTDIFTRWLDLCAEDATIVMSAGNDGDGYMCLSRKFTDEAPSFTTMIADKYTWNGFNIKGAMDIWGDSPQSVDIRLRVWDGTERKCVYESESYAGLASEDVAVLDSDIDTEFAKFFNGKVYLADYVSADNNRYNRYLIFRLTTSAKVEQGWARYHLIVEITGHAGQSVDVFEDAITSELRRQGNEPYCLTGGHDKSISSIACGYNTICIGSTTTRVVTPTLSGEDKTWPSYTEGTTAPTSSYGSTYDGRALPHLCAPGAHIVSATSSYYVNQSPTRLSDVAARGSQGEYYQAECGTSMASPHAAGIFALWLEANPKLTPTDIRRIAIATAGQAGCDITDPRTGAGMIDAVAGLRMVLDEAGATMPMADRLLVFRRDGRLEVDAPEGISYKATVYDMTGRQISGNALPQSPIVVVVTTSDTTIVKKL